MTGVVTFNYDEWVAAYPELSGVSAPAAQGYFDIATTICANKLNPVPTPDALKALLYMLTSHVATLFSSVTAGGASPSTPPGRISNATEGSVSATFDYKASENAQWFLQTKYGALFWQATVALRSFRYVPKGPFSGGPVTWLYPNTGS
jgi:hypothetical protein